MPKNQAKTTAKAEFLIILFINHQDQYTICLLIKKLDFKKNLYLLVYFHYYWYIFINYQVFQLFVAEK